MWGSPYKTEHKFNRNKNCSMETESQISGNITSENSNTEPSKPKLVFIGNLASLLYPEDGRNDCLNKSTCKLLNYLVCFFYQFWAKQFQKQPTQMSKFNNFANFSEVDENNLKIGLKNLKSAEFTQINRMQIEKFLLNPEIFLRNKRFLDLNWHERIIAVMFLIKKNAFLAPPKCFCRQNLVALLKKKSTKRKHELIRFCIKRYVNLLVEKCVPRGSNSQSLTKRKELFYEILNEKVPGTRSKNLIKGYFNEDSKRGRNKRQRVKNISELLEKLSTNPVTKPYFNKTVLSDKFFEIYTEYYEEKKLKVRKLISRFDRLIQIEIFEDCLTILKNKRMKLFFSHEDIKAGYNIISKMFDELE